VNPRGVKTLGPLFTENELRAKIVPGGAVGSEQLLAKFIASSLAQRKQQSKRGESVREHCTVLVVISRKCVHRKRNTWRRRIRPRFYTYEKCPPGRHKLASSTLVCRQTFALRKCVKQFFAQSMKRLYLHISEAAQMNPKISSGRIS